MSVARVLLSSLYSLDFVFYFFDKHFKHFSRNDSTVIIRFIKSASIKHGTTRVRSMRITSPNQFVWTDPRDRNNQSFSKTQRVCEWTLAPLPKFKSFVFIKKNKKF